MVQRSSSTSSPDDADVIDGVLVRPLVWHSDQRGSLSELVRSDDSEMMVAPIGQVYATTVMPGVVKAWHLHQRQWDRMSCVSGRVLLGLVDTRPDSPTHGRSMRVVLGDRNHAVVRVPPGVQHGLKNIGLTEAIVINVVSQPFDRQRPDEQRLPAHGVLDFDWSRVDR